MIAAAATGLRSPVSGAFALSATKAGVLWAVTEAVDACVLDADVTAAVASVVVFGSVSFSWTVYSALIKCAFVSMVR